MEKNLKNHKLDPVVLFEIKTCLINLTFSLFLSFSLSFSLIYWVSIKPVFCIWQMISILKKKTEIKMNTSLHLHIRKSSLEEKLKLSKWETTRKRKCKNEPFSQVLVKSKFSQWLTLTWNEENICPTEKLFVRFAISRETQSQLWKGKRFGTWVFGRK